MMHLQLRLRKRKKKHKNYDELAPVFYFLTVPKRFVIINFFPRVIHTYRNNQDDQVVYLKGLCQLESMRSEVMQITFNCQNSIVFNA